eukprot:scpid69240/ scgid25042/ 
MASALYLHLAVLFLVMPKPFAITLGGIVGSSSQDALRTDQIHGCQRKGSLSSFYPEAVTGFTALSLGGMSKRQCLELRGNVDAITDALRQMFRATHSGRMFEDVQEEYLYSLTVAQCVECVPSAEDANIFNGDAVFFIKAGLPGGDRLRVLPNEELVVEMENVAEESVPELFSSSDITHSFTAYQEEEETATPPCARSSGSGSTQDGEDSAVELGSGCDYEQPADEDDDQSALGEQEVRMSKRFAQNQTGPQTREGSSPDTECRPTLLETLNTWYRCAVHGDCARQRCPGGNNEAREIPESSEERSQRAVLNSEDYLFAEDARQTHQHEGSSRKQSHAVLFLALAIAMACIALAAVLIGYAWRRRSAARKQEDVEAV